MFNVIERLRESSTTTQKIIAFFVSSVVTLGILGVWVMTRTIDRDAAYARLQQGEELPAVLVIQDKIRSIPAGFYNNVKNLGSALNSGFLEGEIEYKNN